MASLPTRIILSLQLVILLMASTSVIQICSISDVEEELQTGGVGGVVGVGRHQREFDYFKLALQWAGTYCRKTRYCCSSNACCQYCNSLNYFTIHGLWTDYNDGSWPSCCSGARFDANEILTLSEALEKYWPTLSCGSPSTCHGGKGTFWGHEWEKHGTCAFPVIRDEYSYFSAALSLYFKYNVTEVLNEAGYVPSNSEKYPVGGIISAIQNAFHITPELECSGGAVEEVRLCFYKDFKPRDCTTIPYIENTVVASQSCPRYVSIPDRSSSGLPQNLAAFQQSI